MRLVTSLLACFCKLFDTAGVLPRFEEGNYTSAYPYLVIINTPNPNPNPNPHPHPRPDPNPKPKPNPNQVIINTASQCWARRPLTPKAEPYTLHPHATPHPNPDPND